jgi:1-acyl-sn-glycerol-3-phosphate acyltransferase
MPTSSTAGRETPANRRRSIPLGRRVFGTILRFLIWLFLKVEVRGESRVPASGAGIIYYNHIHWLDPVVICGQLHRYAIPLTKIEASRWPVVGWLLKGYHVIFITRGVVDRAALKATWDLLRDGDISVISPEGTRSLDGRLLTAKEGLAFVARQAPDCWLIPAAVTGTPSFRWRFPLVNRPTAVITYGAPFRYCWPRGNDGSVVLPDGQTNREMLREMTDEAMAQLAQCLPAEMRGAYTNTDATKHRWLEFI